MAAAWSERRLSIPPHNGGDTLSSIRQEGGYSVNDRVCQNAENDRHGEETYGKASHVQGDPEDRFFHIHNMQDRVVALGSYPVSQAFLG